MAKVGDRWWDGVGGCGMVVGWWWGGMGWEGVGGG